MKALVTYDSSDSEEVEEQQQETPANFSILKPEKNLKIGNIENKKIKDEENVNFTKREESAIDQSKLLSSFSNKKRRLSQQANSLKNSKIRNDDDESVHEKDEEDVDFFGLNQPSREEYDEVLSISEQTREQHEEDTLADPSLSYEAYAAQFKHLQNNFEVTGTQSEDDLKDPVSIQHELLSHIPEHQVSKRSNVAIKSITTEDLMSDMWKYAATRDALLEAESSREKNKFEGAKTSSGRRRNNNIMYLAFQAHEQRKALEEAAAHRKIQQKETRSKYGF